MYHTIQNQTKPNLTMQNQIKFPYIGQNSIVLQNKISKFCMELHLDNIHLPYHSKSNQTCPNHTIPYQIQTKPNIIKSSITLLFFKL